MLIDFPFSSTYKYKHPYMVYIYISHKMVNKRIKRKTPDFKEIHSKYCDCSYNDTNKQCIPLHRISMKTIFDSLYILSLQINNSETKHAFIKVLNILPKLLRNDKYKNCLQRVIKEIDIKDVNKQKHTYFRWMYMINKLFNKYCGFKLPNFDELHDNFCGCTYNDNNSKPTYNYYCPIE